jgi:hypothetical protein
MSTSRAQRPRTPSAPATGIDGSTAVRGASRGFTVLAVGGAIQPWVGQLFSGLGYYWLVIVAVGAFAFAAWNASSSSVPLRQGAVSAVGAYALILPLVYMTTGTLLPEQVVYTTLLAVAVGAGTGAGRARITVRAA